MKFGYPPEQQQPDADLGKSLREGWRNIAPEGKVFGVPSIRTDIPMPTKRSCASTQVKLHGFVMAFVIPYCGVGCSIDDFV